MARHYPSELHLGQKVFVRVDPTAHPVAALVTKIDNEEGVIHVNPIGYKIRWAARPRAISNAEGEFLQYEEQNFFFSCTRSFA